MTTPVRLRLSRRKGSSLQAASRATNGLAAVVVARPTRWGNPFVIGRDGTRERCVELHRKLLDGSVCTDCSAAVATQRAYQDHVARNLPQLRGKNLACWCPLDQPCHADVLLALANP